MIYYFTPYSTEQNLGKAYNEYMRLLPNDDDWGCLLDADTMFLCSDFGTQIEKIVNANKEVGLFTCVTNRSGYKEQRYNNKFSYDADIINHRKIAIECKEKFYSELSEIKSHINGHLLLIKKSTWLNVGGFSENTMRDEKADCNLLGLDDNISRKILKSGLKIMLMKGIYLFHYYRLLEGEKERGHLIKKIKPIKLGASYNLASGSELIRDSILSIRKNVDYITVIYNDVSMNGIKINVNLKDLLQKLKEEKLIDDYKLFIHDKTIHEKEIHNKHKEIAQRNEGLQMCIDNDCTHFMTIDCDEFYTDSEFKKAKEEIINNNFDSSFCKMISYYKDGCHIIDPPEEYYVPFIYKIKEGVKLHIQECPVLCDPSRLYFNGKYKIFERFELQMHHFTYVRRDLREKLSNAPTTEKELNHFNKIIDYFNTWEEGKQALTYNGYFDLKKINPYFKLNIPIYYKRIVSMATHSKRENILKDTIDSIINQCDELHVYLNDYEAIPDFVKDNQKIFYYNKPDGDLGDVGKFYGLQNKEGYLFTCDDDLIYPKDYVNKMITGIIQYNCPVTLHGRIMSTPPIESYYQGSVIYNINCFLESEADKSVHIAGTGCMAWNSNMIKFKINDFKHKNMTDIYASILIHKAGIYIWCLSHENNYIKQNPKTNENTSIWTLNHLNDKIQTDLINENYKYFNLQFEYKENSIKFVKEIPKWDEKYIIKTINTGEKTMSIIKCICIEEFDGSNRFGVLGDIFELEETTATALLNKGLVALYDEKLKEKLIAEAEQKVIDSVLIKEEKANIDTKEFKGEVEKKKAGRPKGGSK